MDHELKTNKGSGIFLECLDVSVELFCKAKNLKFLGTVFLLIQFLQGINLSKSERYLDII